MTTRMLFAASAAALLAGCSSMSGMDHAGMNHGDMNGGAMAAADMAGMPRDAMGYVTMAGASDLFEIQSSQIALQRSQNDGVRRMAQMLITDHTRTTEATMAAARAAGMTPPPPMLDAQKQAMIAELQSATSFDQAWLTQQVMAHQQALALHTHYQRHGDRPQLRRTAGAAGPVVRAHLVQAQRMQGSMGG